jgi:hypothetical protein
LLALLLAISAFIYLTAAIPGPVVSEDKKTASRACLEMFEKNFFSDEYTVLSDWRKSGKFVFEIGLSNTGEDTYRVHMCVVDLMDGTVIKPSIFEYRLWEKPWWQ